MVKFPLVSPGYEAMVDDCDVEKLSKHPWYVLVKRNKSITPYAWGDVDGRRVYMHRFLLDFPDQEIDHIDGNGLNNQRSNLRLSTRALNMANTGPRAGLYKGVTKRNRPGVMVWQAQIKIDGKFRYLGSFATPEEAALSYDKMALEVWGESAYLNFPDQGD